MGRKGDHSVVDHEYNKTVEWIESNIPELMRDLFGYVPYEFDLYSVLTKHKNTNDKELVDEARQFLLYNAAYMSYKNGYNFYDAYFTAVEVLCSFRVSDPAANQINGKYRLRIRRELDKKYSSEKLETPVDPFEFEKIELAVEYDVDSRIRDDEIQSVLATLTENERKVIRNCVYNSSPYSMREYAYHIKRSGQRVKGIRDKAIRKLRRPQMLRRFVNLDEYKYVKPRGYDFSHKAINEEPEEKIETEEKDEFSQIYEFVARCSIIDAYKLTRYSSLFIRDYIMEKYDVSEKYAATVCNICKYFLRWEDKARTAVSDILLTYDKYEEGGFKALARKLYLTYGSEWYRRYRSYI